jgi:hypothetical protein
MGCPAKEMFANRMSAVMNRRPTLEFYPSWAKEGRVMYTEAKMLAYSMSC